MANKELKKYINKLDRIFSHFIRLRDANENGVCLCISCNAPHHWKELDCGHFINRKHMNLRYSEINCNAQCISCNRFDEGNNVGYVKGIIDKYGFDTLNKLTIQKNLVKKFSVFELDLMIKHYTEEVKKLKELKGQ